MIELFHRSLEIPKLGVARIPSPGLSREWGGATKSWVDDSERILLDDSVNGNGGTVRKMERLSVEKAGPRKTVFFPPELTTCAIVTCGGLCPGINDVIRSLVMHAHYGYGIRRVLGLRYG